MKNLICLLISVFPLLAAAQSVPNGDFESWLFVGLQENPESWTTDNTDFQTTVLKDFDSYEGDFAMRVVARPIGVGEYGEASTVMDIDAIPAALNFYAKIAVQNGGVSVNITFHNNEFEVYSESWFGTESTDGYVFVSMPLDQIEPVITHARISVSAQVGDFAPGTAAISVDAMDFGEPLSVSQADRPSLKLYPNPGHSELQIDCDLKGHSEGVLEIFDQSGQVVHQAVLGSLFDRIRLNPAHLPAGIYVVRIQSIGGWQVSEKWVKTVK